MTVCILWYAFYTAEIALNDYEYLVKQSPIVPIPEVVALQAGVAAFNMDSSGAIELYRKAVMLQQINIDGWLSFLRIQSSMGQEDEARNGARILEPLIVHTVFWKWKEILIAYGIHDEKYFSSCFNYVLRRMPNRHIDACRLAFLFWNNWDTVIASVAEENRNVFLSCLLAQGETEAALKLWAVMADKPETLEKKNVLAFCEYLLGKKYYNEAVGVWKAYNSGDLLVNDGGFELEPLNAGFGWRPRVTKEVDIERSTDSPHSGRYSLHLRFHGTKNLSLIAMAQCVPVEGGKRYRLSFFHKQRNLTTDQGVGVTVYSYGDGNLIAKSDLAVGTSPWREEQLDVTVPEGTRILFLCVQRNESLRLDNKIAGDYWIDDIRLEPVAR